MIVGQLIGGAMLICLAGVGLYHMRQIEKHKYTHHTPPAGGREEMRGMQVTITAVIEHGTGFKSVEVTVPHGVTAAEIDSVIEMLQETREGRFGSKVCEDE